MGTKVHCKTFLPEHCTTGEVNVDGTRGWPVYYEDRALSMQFCNGLASMLVGSPGYEKEVLRQTMLKHETIFRTQVYELHRLYRIQRELTDELRRNSFCSYSTNVQAPQSSSPLPSMWNPLKSPSMPAASSSYNRPLSSSIYNSKEAVNCFNTRAELSPVPSESSFWNSSDVTNPELKRRSNGVVIDLRLPGDAYLDVGNAKERDADPFTQKLFQATDLSSVNSNNRLKKNTVLSLGSSECEDGLQFQKLSSVLRGSQRAHQLSDLNEPIESSSNFSQRGGPEQHMDLLNEQRKTSQAIHFENGFPSFLGMDGVKRQKLWLSNHDSSNTSGIDHLYGETAKKFAENDQFKPMKSQESYTFALSRQSQSETCFKDNSRPNGTGINIPANAICNVLTMPQVTYPVPSNPNLVNAAIAFPSLSSLKDLKDRADNVPVSDSQSTYFWGSTSTRKSQAEDVSNQKATYACYKPEFNLSFSQSTDYHDSVPSETKSSSQLYLPICNSDKQNETVNVGHPLTSNQGNQLSFMGLHGSASNSVKDIDLNMALPIDLSDSFCQNKELSVPGCKKIFGVPVPDSSFNGATKDLHPTESSSKEYLFDLENELPEESVITPSDKSSATGGRPAINLNSVDSSTDSETKSPNNIAGEETVTATSLNSDVNGKRKLRIDLELSAELFSEEVVGYTSSNPEDHLPAPVAGATDTKESDIHEDNVCKIAAEAIIEMSSRICERPANVSSLPLDEISADCLHWFADVVSSHIGASDTSGVPSSGEGDDRQGASHDGLDFFEAMTLQLVETKVDDLLPTTVLDNENPKEDTSSITPCLLTKARRGQARKRRQRRDFQKDVLPGLASLSRHEVSEDIQIIGGMMRAVGQPWQSGVTRRGTGRNARGCQGKGRRRQWGEGKAAVAAAAEVVAVPVESPPTWAKFADFEIEGKGIMGWGRTRRCRRPRCPPGMSIPPALS